MKKTKSIIALVLFSTLLFTNCKKEDPEPEPEPTPVTPPPAGLGVNSTPQAQFEINGAPQNHVQGKDTVLMVKTNDKKLPTVGNNEVTYHSTFSKKTTTYIKFTKNLLIYTGNKTPAESSFRNFFSVGEVPYLTPDPTYGMRITWVDQFGVVWATDKGTRDQSASSFKIVESKEVKNAYQEMVIYATFKCNLYDDNGHVVALTNGKVVCNFENN